MQKYSQCQKDFFKFEIVKAPLATFDTIDLGSDDESTTHHTAYKCGTTYRSASQSSENSVESYTRNPHGVPTNDAQFSDSDSGTSTPTNSPKEVKTLPQTLANASAVVKNKRSSSVTKESAVERTRPSVVKEPAIVLRLDANISDKFKKKRKDSASSDSDSDVFTFENIQARHEKAPPNHVNGKNGQDKVADAVTLSPVHIDPNQIKSPSKRKAYEKRLQRLQVTTSPIARPRSTTPISVVTLDEYVLSSPEFSPTTDSKSVEKLKIVLPADEFTPRAKSPRKDRTRKDSDSIDICTEELLFSHTRSALVVDHPGQIPKSPKRVLIPPTISPATSPKISAASNLNLENPGSPKYVYYRSQTHCISPLAAPANENWATFPDTLSTADDIDDSQEDLTPQNQPCSSAPSNSVTHSGLEGEEGEEEEDVLTVNIASSGKCEVELTLSASNSSNSMNPSPDSSSAVTSTNPLGQDRTESELDFTMDTSEEDSIRNCQSTPESDQY